MICRKCPDGYGWIDGSYVDLGCLQFYAADPMSWFGAQNFCNSTSNYTSNSYLVEIYNDYQQNFIIEKARNITDPEGRKLNWWIGLTDNENEGTYVWAHSKQTATYFAWDEDQLDSCQNDECDYVCLLSYDDDNNHHYNWVKTHAESDLDYWTNPLCQYFP